MQEAFWILCSDRIAANENNLEVVNQKLADEFLMDEKVRPFSKDSFFMSPREQSAKAKLNPRDMFDEFCCF